MHSIRHHIVHSISRKIYSCYRKQVKNMMNKIRHEKNHAGKRKKGVNSDGWISLLMLTHSEVLLYLKEGT